MFIEKSFEANGLTLSYDEGSGTGPPMLLLHGLTGSRDAWLPNFIAAYGESWHIYNLDQRGHGKSGRAADDRHYRLVDYAADVVAFLQRQVDEPAVVVGHSLGAINSIGIGAMAADRVRGLLLLDPPLFTRNQTLEARPGARLWFGWIYETMRQNPTFDEVLAACRAFSPEADDAMLHDMAKRVSWVAPGTVKTALDERLLADFDLAAALQQITCPTLLLYGEWERDATVHPADVEFVRAHLPHIQAIKIEDGTHGFAWDQWDAVRPHIDAFLATI